MSKREMLRNVRLSYEHIFQPSALDDRSEPKFSATFIIPKDHPDASRIKRAMYEAGAEKYPNAFKGQGWPAGYTCPLKDGDTDVNGNGERLCERNPEYAGAYVMKASAAANRRPAAVGRKKETIREEDGVIYSGCFVNASIAFAGYEYGKIKKGVTCYLNGVQFVADGERFGSDATGDFDELDDTEGGDGGYDFI